MRFLLPAGLLAAAMAAPLAAQTTNAPATGNRAGLQEKIIGFLPQADQDRVVAAYNKALADNPKLNEERKELEKGWAELADDNSQERMAFVEKGRAHNQKIRQAMLKEDPTLAPIFNRIDQHLSTMRAQHQKALSPGSGTP